MPICQMLCCIAFQRCYVAQMYESGHFLYGNEERNPYTLKGNFKQRKYDSSIVYYKTFCKK